MPTPPLKPTIEELLLWQDLANQRTTRIQQAESLGMTIGQWRHRVEYLETRYPNGIPTETGRDNNVITTEPVVEPSRLNDLMQAIDAAGVYDKLDADVDYTVRTKPETIPARRFTEEDFLNGEQLPDSGDYSPPFVDPVEYGKSLYEEAMAKSDKDLAFRRANPHDLCIRKIHTDAPILITNLSDLHLENRFCDRRRALEDIRLVRDTEGAFGLFGGDGIDNFIKHAAAMISTEKTPAQAFAMLEYYLNEGGGKVIGGISGNHEYWTKQFAGIDQLTSIMGRLKIAYSPHRLRVILKINGLEYHIELRHSYRFKSSINLSNQFLRMWEHSDWEWDIGLVGHTHDGPYVVPFTRHSKERWGGLTGSYKVFDDHGEQWGFNAAYPSSPGFILWPAHKEIVAFKDLRRGIATLKAIRESEDR